jgi:phosphoglycolate phosphatase-like HAD superfamily hydrolase
MERMTAVPTSLASWNNTSTRDAITEFVAQVTQTGGEHFVPPAARVAVFDNDGTLWTEKPLPIQADFLLRRIGEMAKADPSLTSRQPWKAVAEQDYGWLSGVVTKHYAGDDSDLKVLLGGILQAYEGATIEEFERIASSFMHTNSHPTLKRPYVTCGFRPMIDLLDYLAAHGFTSYIASGGGRDFMRTISQECYDIPPERVIGSSVGLEFSEVDGVAQIVHTAKPDLFDDGPEKPVRIWSRVGRRPILSAGNSNGDIPMLAFTGGAGLPALRLLVLHDDAEREFDYTTGAERALERARTDGWTVVSVKNDWTSVFDD